MGKVNPDPLHTQSCRRNQRGSSPTKRIKHQHVLCDPVELDTSLWQFDRKYGPLRKFCNIGIDPFV
jgi:hypothetical protein